MTPAALKPAETSNDEGSVKGLSPVDLNEDQQGSESGYRREELEEDERAHLRFLP